MPRQFLYKVISNDNVRSVLEAGLTPRFDNYGISQSRVWLLTSLNAAYRVAYSALIGRKDFHVHHISLPDEDSPSIDFGAGFSWRKDNAFPSGTSEGRLFRVDIYSIITIERSSIRLFKNDVEGFVKELHRTIVWTPDHIPPTAFLSIKPIDRAYFQSPVFKRFLGQPVSTARARAEYQRQRNQWLIDAVETRGGGLKLRKVRNPAYITNRGRSKRG